MWYSERLRQTWQLRIFSVNVLLKHWEAVPVMEPLLTKMEAAMILHLFLFRLCEGPFLCWSEVSDPFFWVSALSWDPRQFILPGRCSIQVNFESPSMAVERNLHRLSQSDTNVQMWKHNCVSLRDTQQIWQDAKWPTQPFCSESHLPSSPSSCLLRDGLQRQPPPLAYWVWSNNQRISTVSENVLGEHLYLGTLI